MRAVSTRPDDDDDDDDDLAEDYPSFFESVGNTFVDASGGLDRLIRILIMLMSLLLVSNLLVALVMLYIAMHQP